MSIRDWEAGAYPDHWVDVPNFECRVCGVKQRRLRDQVTGNISFTEDHSESCPHFEPKEASDD